MPRNDHTIKEAIKAVTGAIRAEASGTLTAEAKEQAINGAMDVVDNSNFNALADGADEAIELQNQIEDQINADAADDGDAEGPAFIEPPKTDDIPF